MNLLNSIVAFFKTSDPKAIWDYDNDLKYFEIKGLDSMGAVIANTGGKAVLKNARTGDVIATYSRERDARRGALRRGLTIV